MEQEKRIVFGKFFPNNLPSYFHDGTPRAHTNLTDVKNLMYKWSKIEERFSKLLTYYANLHRRETVRHSKQKMYVLIRFASIFAVASFVLKIRGINFFLSSDTPHSACEPYENSTMKTRFSIFFSFIWTRVKLQYKIIN